MQELTELEKLLYRKNSAENLLTIWEKGIQMYSNFINECDKVISNKKRYSKMERALAEKEKHEAEIPLRHYSASWKLTKREVKHHIIPSIEKIATDEEKKNIQFDDLEAKMKELSENSFFASTEKKPDNVELIEVNKLTNEYLKNLKELSKSLQDKIKEENDPYTDAKLKKELFDTNLHIVTLEKRLEERLDYYNNQFLPKYEKDMKDAERRLPEMLDRAKEIIDLGVDPKMMFLIGEYEKNKHDKEKTWMFYTALDKRLNNISKEVMRNQDKFKDNLHLATVIP